MFAEVQSQQPSLRHCGSACMLLAYCDRDTEPEAVRETKDRSRRTDIGAELEDHPTLTSCDSTSHSVLSPRISQDPCGSFLFYLHLILLVSSLKNI